MGEREGRISRPMAVATTEQDAAIHDTVVVPRYSGLFAQMILREIPKGLRAQVLDIGCGTGNPALEVLKKLDAGGRVIAVDRDPVLLDVARRRALGEAGRRVFFRVESAEELKFGADVFDIVVANLVVWGLEQRQKALSEMHRVLVPGGRVLLTQATTGSFGEVLDMLREIALRNDAPQIGQRAETLAQRYPPAADIAKLVEAAGFVDVRIETEVFRLPYRAAREILTDPLIHAIALPEWRWVAGFEPGGESVLEQVERSLDTYFAAGPLSLTVNAALVTARKP